MKRTEKVFALLEQVVEIGGDLEAAKKALESGAAAPHLDASSTGGKDSASGFSIRTMRPVRFMGTIGPNRIPKGCKMTGNY